VSTEWTGPDLPKTATAPTSEAIRPLLVGGVIVGSTTFDDQHRHDRNPIIQSELDHYLLQLYMVGAGEAWCEDRPFLIHAGDICIFDLARPFSAVVTPGSTVSLILPRNSLDRAGRGKSLHGIILPSGRPLTRILADLVLGMCRTASDLSNEEASVVEQALLNLLAAGLAQQSHETPAASTPMMQMLRQQILDFIEAHLYERELGPSLLMQRHQISRAHLYRIFAADGGIAKIIRDKRLDAAYREIALGTKATGKSITDVALQLGFSNSSQFARAFQRRFTMTPSEARQESLRGHVGRSQPELRVHFGRQVA